MSVPLIKDQLVNALEKMDFEHFNNNPYVMYKQYLFQLREPIGFETMDTKVFTCIIDLRNYDSGIPKPDDYVICWADLKANAWTTGASEVPKEVMELFIKVNGVNKDENKPKTNQDSSL